MFNSEKRAERHESRVVAMEERAENNADKALRNLRARRAWLIQKMAMPSGKLGGHAFDDEVGQAARELHYLDAAIASITSDEG